MPLWRKWKFQFGACLWVFPRAICCVLLLIQCLIFQHVIYFGHPGHFSRPLTGLRRVLWNLNYTFTCWALRCSVGYRGDSVVHTNEEVEEAYAKYLGKDWLKNEPKNLAERQKKGYKRCSTIVVNHIGFIDELTLLA